MSGHSRLDEHPQYLVLADILQTLYKIKKMNTTLNFELLNVLIALVSVFIAVIGLYFAIPKDNKYRSAIIIGLSFIIFLIANFILYKISQNSTNSLVLLNLIVAVIFVILGILWIFQKTPLAYLPKAQSQKLMFGLNHIDEQVIPHYDQKDTISLNDKKDAMSDILRQISITTIPTTIENLARMAIFEVMPKGNFRVLASHQLDTHRISKLERTFSHDANNIKGIVGKVANTKEPLLISDLKNAPDSIKDFFQTMEENKLPGQAPSSMLCFPILNTVSIEKDSKCLAVLSISCSTSNAISQKQVEEVSKYANRARKILLSMDSKILFDPQSSAVYRAITISGEVGSGKSTLVAELRSILEPAGWKIVSIGEKFREFCKIHEIDVDQIEKLDDDLHLKYDEFQKNMLKEEELIIIEGRLSGYLGTDIPDVLTIYLNLPFEERVKRAMQRDETDKQTTEAKLKNRDGKDVARYKRLYKIDDYRDKKYYKLYLNTDDSPYNLAKKVLNSLKMK